MRKFFCLIIVIVGFISLFIASCGSDINTNYDVHFTEDGRLILDSDDSIDAAPFVPTLPNSIKFFVEVSGSMNGFFRPGIATDFKTDVWQVLSYYSPATNGVTILTNTGEIGKTLLLEDFRTSMNTGAFISTASTRVPVMLETIYSNLNADAGEVAVLISDMKYSPVGQAAPDVLLKQYAIDISKIIGKHGLAVSLILATSSYADRKGQIVYEESPYYYLVIGKSAYVAEIRNGISILLNHKEHFVDNIETGFDYGKINYSFGIPNGCWQLESEPTFCGYDPAVDDTCTIRLKVRLENYRWRTAQENILRESLVAKCLYGSEISIGDIEFEILDKTKTNDLKRTAIATIDLKLTNMATDSEVIEWGLQLPDTEYTLFDPFITGALGEDDITKSYSMDSFIQGMFYGGILNKQLKPNYILVSKNS